jgi:short-subunit dehydrogenase
MAVVRVAVGVPVLMSVMMVSLRHGGRLAGKSAVMLAHGTKRRTKCPAHRWSVSILHERYTMVRLKPIDEQIVVITGASSGLGLATAKLAAQRGAKVVLAARTREALAQAVDEINQAGPGRASFVVADVARRADHEKIAAHAIERHGRIDTWVNNAGVLLFGELENQSEEDMRRLFDTNFWGVVHGSLIAAKHLRASGGALINLGSLEADRGVPLQAIYAASKFAVKGFTEVLRTELQAAGAPISVTLVKPAAMATPLPHHAKSFESADPAFPPPLYAPEEAARMILFAAERPVRTVYVGGAARALGVAAAIAPRLTDWISETLLIPLQNSESRRTSGDNLAEGRSEAKVRGDTGSRLVRPSLYSLAARHPAMAWAVAGGVAGGALLWARAKRV